MYHKKIIKNVLVSRTAFALIIYISPHRIEKNGYKFSIISGAIKRKAVLNGMYDNDYNENYNPGQKFAALVAQSSFVLRPLKINEGRYNDSFCTFSGSALYAL
jgi:hypothetical protein